MAEAVGEWIIGAAALSEGEEMVRFLEGELELLNPLLPFIHESKLSKDRVESIKQMVARAQDVANTYSRTVLESNKASIQRKPTYLFKLKKMIRELERVKVEIINAEYELMEFVDRQWRLEEDDQSFEDLPALDNLMFYLLLFPVGFKIPARRLIALWIAEGLIKPNKYGIESVEDIGQHYLNEIERQYYVRTFNIERKSNGKVKTCWFDCDNANRARLFNIAREKKFMAIEAEGVRRLVDSSNTSAEDAFSIKILGNHSILDDVPKYGDLVSFLSFDYKQGRRERDDIGYFINECILAGCFKWLKVLDLERVFRPVLPEKLGELALLKYLGLRWTYLKDLPEFVKGLLKLEVLDVKHTYITILPASIWRMQSLRHLYLSEAYRTRFPRPTSTISLDNLQTLWGAFVDEDTCVKGGLDSLVSIRKLGLSCGSKHKASATAKQLEAISKWISNLKLLESLSLKSRDVDGKPDHLHLTSLEMNTNLSTVYLLGKLNPSVVCEFPVSLTDITLSGSELEVDPLEFLDRLPNLQALRLLGRSVKHTRIRCSTRGFPVLKMFCIWKLENLEELEVEEGSVACLEELDIRSCHRMQSPPSGLPFIRTLKKFKVANMSDAFKDQAGLLLRSLEQSIIDLDLD